VLDLLPRDLNASLWEIGMHGSPAGECHRRRFTGSESYPSNENRGGTTIPPRFRDQINAYEVGVDVPPPTWKTEIMPSIA
jgi:hypothetical protein